MKLFETLNGTFVNLEKIVSIYWTEDTGSYYSYIKIDGIDELDFLDVPFEITEIKIHNMHVLAVEYILRSKNSLIRYEELQKFLDEIDSL